MWGRGGPGSQGRAVLGAAISAARRLELRWEQVSESEAPAVYTESELVTTSLGSAGKCENLNWVSNLQSKERVITFIWKFEFRIYMEDD